MNATAEPLDLDLRVDGLELILWSDGTADVLVLSGAEMAWRFEARTVEARRLLRWLRTRFRPTLAELLAEHARSGARPPQTM